MGLDILRKYAPESAVFLMAEWIKAYNFHFKISKSRSSKLGDFRPAFQGKPAKISVNGDLNPFHFMVTFTHEVAHAAVWKKYQNKVKPHGIEWQTAYSELLQIMMKTVDLPETLELGLRAHLQRPKASSCADPQLYKLLQQYNTDQEELIYLDELEEGALFSIKQKRFFKKGIKRRSRYECLDLNNKRIYYVSGHAEVERYHLS